MEFTISFDSIIGILALLVAIGSYIYTWNFNHYAVDLVRVSTKKIHGVQKVEFEIQNLSTKPIKITGITLLDNQGNKIEDNNFSPEQFEKYQNFLKSQQWEKEHKNDLLSITNNPYNQALNPALGMKLYSDESSPFVEPTYLKIDDSEYFSYFIDKLPDTIKIRSDKNINYFSKEKSFSFNSYK